MKIRRRTIAIGLAVLAVSVVLVLVALSLRLGPVDGVWTSTGAYAGTTRGSVKLLIKEDGQVHVIVTPGAQLWWAERKYTLRLRGDKIEVRSGQQLVSELHLKRARRELLVLELSLPTEVLRLRKIDEV